MSHQIFISKEEKPAPAFKAGRDMLRVTPLFRAKAGGRMSGTALISNAAHP